jgi:hypothetical protein
MPMKFVNLTMLSPWDGFIEPRYSCPICKSFFSGSSVSHPKFACDWLGAKVEFEHYGHIVTGDVCEVNFISEEITIEIQSDVPYAIKVYGVPTDLPKLKIIEKPLSMSAKLKGETRGRANRWTYTE